MQFKSIALATSSLVAACLAVAPANAASTMMGKVNLGYAHNWEDVDFGGESADFDYPSVFGGAAVNIPYNDTVNLQLDVLGRTSLDTGDFFSGKAITYGHFGFGAHINHRDDQGLLGVFGAAGRVQDLFSGAVFAAGIDGQYYCGPWTIRGQLAYLDAAEDWFLLKDAGLARVGVNHYLGKNIKLTADLAYIDGEQAITGYDAQQWAWALGAHYWFGKSIPATGFVEYRGRQVEVHAGPDAELDTHSINLGVTLYFGGDGFEDADRNGASADLPDFEWFRLSTASP